MTWIRGRYPSVSSHPLTVTAVGNQRRGVRGVAADPCDSVAGTTDMCRIDGRPSPWTWLLDGGALALVDVICEILTSDLSRRNGRGVLAHLAPPADQPFGVAGSRTGCGGANRTSPRVGTTWSMVDGASPYNYQRQRT